MASFTPLSNHLLSVSRIFTSASSNLCLFVFICWPTGDASLWCSLMRLRRVLSVSPMYCAGQSVQRMLYIAPDLSSGLVLSLGATRRLLTDVCGLKWAPTPTCLIFRQSASVIPCTYGRVTCPLGRLRLAVLGSVAFFCDLGLVHTHLG